MTIKPRPLFDTLEYVQNQYKKCQTDESSKIISAWVKQCFLDTNFKLSAYAVKDYQHVLNFLYGYRGSNDTFNAYRRDLERLIQWCWLVQEKSILALKRADIEEFIAFCQSPPKRWIGTKMVARFIDKDGMRYPNPAWYPFVVKISKKSVQKGQHPDKSNFELSAITSKQIFAILGSFYNYLIQEQITEINPILQIRQKSRFLRKQQQPIVIRRLSVSQWEAVLSTAINLADQYPAQHERTLFIMNALYGMYLRVSELTVTARWSPKMRDFSVDEHGNWWFQTVGKGNKMRLIAVSLAMLNALKRWRKYLSLSPLPSVDEQTPLIPKAIGKGAVESTRTIRKIVQECFDVAVKNLLKNNNRNDADTLRVATVHWLRHTGISDDVKIRPREHVRDDAGHSSGAITDRYINVELQERAKSAQKKKSRVKTNGYI